MNPIEKIFVIVFVGLVIWYFILTIKREKPTPHDGLIPDAPAKEYMKYLEELSPTDYQRLTQGDWSKERMEQLVEDIKNLDWEIPSPDADEDIVAFYEALFSQAVEAEENDDGTFMWRWPEDFIPPDDDFVEQGRYFELINDYREMEDTHEAQSEAEEKDTPTSDPRISKSDGTIWDWEDEDKPIHSDDSER